MREEPTGFVDGLEWHIKEIEILRIVPSFLV